MADVRELLARLNPTTVKFDVGKGGGVPELTNLDIAGALAFVTPGLGREVLEACWWPDGAKLRRHKLRDAVVALVEPEIRRQRERLFEAVLDIQIAKQSAEWSPRGMTSELRAEIDRSQARHEQAQAQCWPVTTLESLPTLAGAVLAEIAGAPHCETCEGRGAVITESSARACIECSGSGLVAVSDRKRAAAIGRDESVFRRHWRPVYMWMLDRFRDAEQSAAVELVEALRRDAA